MNKEVRVRVAPSPTGFLHIGTAQSALYNYLFARHHGGKFIVRIEDTDAARSEKKFETDILEGFKWLDLTWDEFYRQSDRMQIYAKYIQKLLDEKKAFWCYHSPEELEQEQRMQQEQKLPPRHVCTHKKAEPPRQGSGVIRLDVDEHSNRKIIVDDLIRGRVEFEERLLGDFSIARNESSPLYHFSVVVDDYELTISHVIRGEDHLANTPKHILIQEVLGIETPHYAHLPLLLGADRSKLSKRHGSTSLNMYRSEGYLPDAIVNYLALLSFSAPAVTEIMSREAIAEIFEIDKVHHSGAVFDIEKLKWLNATYIKKLSDESLKQHLNPYVEEMVQGHFDSAVLDRGLGLIRERIRRLIDVREFKYFFVEPEYDPELLCWKDTSRAETIAVLQSVAQSMPPATDALQMRDILDAKSRELQNKGAVYWPVRVALSGTKSSPDPVEIAAVIGTSATMRRLTYAYTTLAATQ